MLKYLNVFVTLDAVTNNNYMWWRIKNSFKTITRMLGIYID